MATINVGGPAFPQSQPVSNLAEEMGLAGMSLRDWFAGQIAAACVARADGNDPRIDRELIATNAYGVADALLIKRVKVS